jgi:hypothetical protein
VDFKNINSRNNRHMKEYTRWFAGVLAAVGGLALAGSAQAQAVTGTTYLSNVLLNNNSPNALYAGWATGTTITSLPAGVEVNSANYGSCYYAIPEAEWQTLNSGDTIATLVFTVNSPTVGTINWMGTPFILTDSTTGVGTSYGGYSASGNGGSDPGTTWNGNVVTEKESLSGAQLAAIQAGGDAITGFNLEVDPASFAGPPTYDITFNSLTLSPVPEPTSVALLGIGAAGWLVVRRRNQAS